MGFWKLALRLLLPLAAMAAAMPAAATVAVRVQGVIFWDSYTPVSAHSSPDGISQFSFDLPSTLPADTIAGGEYDVEAITNFFFTLDEIDVVEPLLRISFFPVETGGLFDLVFASQTIVMYGYSDLGSNGKLPRGFFPAIDVFDSLDPDGDGVALLFVAGVPEPASWMLLITGFAATGVALRRRRAIAG